MFDLPVKSVMDRNKFITVSPDHTISQAAQLMAHKHFGVVWVIDDAQLVGVLTERDVVFRVIGQGLDPHTTQVQTAMTHHPQSIGLEDAFGTALIKMHTHGVRHLPVIEQGQAIGVVSARHAMDPELDEFVSEARRREHYQTGP
ncbi:CBS domain-containing protein [Rhodoferax sp.]|uniref:CBS domain-containing protein n=1 Tax=Rhodoferax sp. TaxID=50421 RepID=UPI00261718E5|nr:CBS domain-containing protein [Rhodoferax sp.]MDD4942678.1 CBS domain-containing protein [Rhodoferax sp.]MDD5480255.1 CBS domain-containing protein [Rhodoferax sp.]